MSKSLIKPDSSKILSVVPSENAFFFCTAEGVYTKISAISLEDFADKLDGVNAMVQPIVILNDYAPSGLKRVLLQLSYPFNN